MMNERADRDLKEIKKKLFINGRSGNPKFYEIIGNLAELYSKKNKQYATKETPEGNFYRTAILCQKLMKGEIKNKPLVQALFYMAKQIDGVYEIVGECKENTVDSLKDKFSDIAIYSIICMILIEQEEQEKASHA